MTRLPLSDSDESVIALPNRSRPTSSVVIEMRAGPIRPNIRPCSALETSSIQNWMRSVASANPMPIEPSSSTNCPNSMSRRFESRSAATPPKSVDSPNARPKQKNTMPSAPSLSLRSHASSARSRNCIWMLMKENTPLSHSSRNAGTPSAANVAVRS